MKVEYLREFLLLADKLNYHRAAEAMYITDSVLSRHIATIENELGVTLFYRNTRSIELTPIGKALRKRAQALIKIYDDMLLDIELEHAGYEHTLRVGLPYNALSDYLGNAVTEFANKFPSTNLTFLASTPATCIPSVLRDETDVAIVAKFSTLSERDLIFKPLFKEPLLAVLSRNHPLCRQPYTTCAALSSMQHICINNAYHHAAWEFYSQHYAKNGYELGEPKIVQQIEMVATVCQQNNVVYLTPWHMRNFFPSSLRCIPLNEPELCRDVCLVFKPGKRSSVEDFMKSFKNITPYGWPSRAPDFVKTFGWDIT